MPWGGFRRRAPRVPPNPNEGVKNWCEKHWDPIREGVYEGNINGLLTSVLLVEKTVEDERFQKIAKKYSKPGTSPTELEYNWAIRKTAPQCCFVGEEALVAVLERCRITEYPPWLPLPAPPAGHVYVVQEHSEFHEGEGRMRLLRRVDAVGGKVVEERRDTRTYTMKDGKPGQIQVRLALLVKLEKPAGGSA